MSLAYIIERTGKKMGLDPSDAQQRKVLLGYINEAAKEVYEMSDIPGSLKERVFFVDSNGIISFPPDVYVIRGMKECNHPEPWRLVGGISRYSYDWKDCWRSWIVLGYSPICRNIKNGGTVMLSVSEVETPTVYVSVAGSNPASNRVEDVILLDSTEKLGSVPFTSISMIKKNRVNRFNIKVFDVDGNTIAVIPNNMLESRYLLVDVSMYNFSRVGERYMDVLYKEALPVLSEDFDEFPVPGYDDIIVDKAIQLWAEEKGDIQEAIAWDAKASRSLGRKQYDTMRGQEDKIQFVPNRFDALFQKCSAFYHRYFRR